MVFGLYTHNTFRTSTNQIFTRFGKVNNLILSMNRLKNVPNDRGIDA